MDKEFVLKNTVENELLRFLGVKIIEVGPTKTVLQMEVTPRVHQYVGIMNGGISYCWLKRPHRWVRLQRAICHKLHRSASR